MIISIFQVDAFAERLFEGGPASVCVLQQGWLPDVILQRIAAENNHSETAFIVPDGPPFWRIRWFTPTQEVKLCGHATLAAAHVLFEIVAKGSNMAVFESASGRLTARLRSEKLIELDFPAAPPRRESEPNSELAKALGAEPAELWRSEDKLVAVFETEAQIRALTPDFRALAAIKGALFFIATAPGSESDFVLRFFAPAAGIDEDPVTGMAQTILAPFWAERLEKPRLESTQLSPRGAVMISEPRGNRVAIAGHCVRYMEGFIEL